MRQQTATPESITLEHGNGKTSIALDDPTPWEVLGLFVIVAAAVALAWIRHRRP